MSCRHGWGGNAACPFCVEVQELKEQLETVRASFEDRNRVIELLVKDKMKLLKDKAEFEAALESN